MPNIMITKRCNLSCPYCFAERFVNHAQSDYDIGLETFQEILAFILGDGSVHDLGLIGGEPTCHHDFRKLLTMLNEDDRIRRITIYTNGILLGDYLDELASEKIFLLINCNSPAQMGAQYEQLVCVLKKIADLPWKRRVTLGINYYTPELDISYMLRLVELFQPERLRVSVSVPQKAEDPFRYFLNMKPAVFSFFTALKARGVVPFFDCNIFPSCLISTEEMRQFEAWGSDNPFLLLKKRPGECLPVIDIMDDMTAVRCFGLSEYTRVPIREFATVTDLRNFYLRTVDAYAANTFYDEKCAKCYKFKTMKCSGGCLIYKMDRVMNNRKLVEQQNGNTPSKGFGHKLHGSQIH